MRNFRGIIVAAVFAALTLLLKVLGENYSQLIGMAYPFASKTYMEFAAVVSNTTDLLVWQIVIAVFAVAVVTTFGLMILFRWNIFRWLGWVLAPASIAVFLWAALWGLNNYAKPIEESMKLEVPDYSVSELKEAAQFYRTQADRLAGKVDRDESGDIVLPSLEDMNKTASAAYDNIVWEYSVFAGPRGPVKALGWAEMFSKFGTAGITIGLTGEAAVNLDSYGVEVPFDMCHEMGHLLAFAREDEANFAGYLACEYSKDDLFRYSGFLEAFLYCADELYKVSPANYNDIWKGASDQLLHDVEALNKKAKETDGPMKEAGQAANNAFLEASGQEDGIETYSQVTDLLVAWYEFKYVVDDTPEETKFDPFNYEEVFPTEATEPETEPEETEET